MRRSLWIRLLAPVALTAGCVQTANLTATLGLTVGAYTAFDLISRTFTGGSTVVTRTYQDSGTQRQVVAIDFNGDGKVDPVVGYGGTQAVVQILLSEGPVGTVDYVSLTLDSLLDMEEIADLAVADINGDERLDILVAAKTGVWYLRHPTGKLTTTDLRFWNVEPLDASVGLAELTTEEIEALIEQTVGPGVDLNDYNVTLEQGFRHVEVADFDMANGPDVAASRMFRLTLEPKEGVSGETILIVDGDLIVFLNPGWAEDGVGWNGFLVGEHERLDDRFDRAVPSGLIVSDMDGDGDFDLLSAAQEDNNVQVAWFENPGTDTLTTDDWIQWRVGSVRGAYAIALADVTGDGRDDVVATGTFQKQVFLFRQPATGAKREFDWDASAIATFENYEPRDVQVADMDNDGALEIVVGATEGAVRLFQPPADPLDTWVPEIVATFDPAGTVGKIGVADVDNDGDLDLIVVVGESELSGERVALLRNDG